MSVLVELEPEAESLLRQRADANGCDLPGYVKRLIDKDIRRQKTLDEILAPFRDAVTASGMSDDELDALFTQTPREQRG